jgi:hypothetical protein
MIARTVTTLTCYWLAIQNNNKKMTAKTMNFN